MIIWKLITYTRWQPTPYTVSHRECEQFRPYVHEKFWKIQDNFDPDGQLDSIAPEARSNPTARQGRTILNFFKKFSWTQGRNCPQSMGHSIGKRCFHTIHSSLQNNFRGVYLNFRLQEGITTRFPRMEINGIRQTWPICHHRGDLSPGDFTSTSLASKYCCISGIRPGKSLPSFPLTISATVISS